MRKLISVLLLFCLINPVQASTNRPDVIEAKNLIKVGAGAASASAILQANSTSKGFLPPRMTTAQRDAISSPAAGLLIFNTDTNQTNQFDGTSWGAVAGGGGGGEHSYIANGEFEQNADGVAAYKDAASATPEDGTGGSPGLTCTRTTSGPITGAGSLLITKGGSNQLGEGCSIAVSLERDGATDNSALGQVLTVSFDYAIASGTYSDGASATAPSDLTFWLYGPTDGTPQMRQLVPTKLLGHGLASRPWQGEVQVATSGKDYLLLAHQSRDATDAYTVKIDNVKLTKQRKSYGPIVTESGSTLYPVTSNITTNATLVSRQHRAGDRLYVEGRILFSGTNTQSVTGTIILPSGLTIDSNKIAATGRLQVGSWTYRVASSGAQTTGGVTIATGAVGSGAVELTNVTPSANQPYTIANNDAISFHFSVPITGWTGTNQLSSDAATGVVAGGMRRTTTQSISAGSTTTIAFDSVIDQKGISFNTSTGVATLQVPGDYRVCYATRFTTGGTAPGGVFTFVSLNDASTERGNWYQTAFSANATYTPTGCATFNGRRHGDTFRIKINTASQGITVQGSGTFDHASFYIERLSGPEQIAASNVVSAVYKTGAGQSLTSSTAAIINFGTAEIDTHNVVTTGSGWVFTAPMAGIYDVSALCSLNNGGAVSSWTIQLRKNGTIIAQMRNPSQSSTSFIISASLNRQVQLLQGDTINVYGFQDSGASRSLHNDANYNYVSIKRIGGVQ